MSSVKLGATLTPENMQFPVNCNIMLQFIILQYLVTIRSINHFNCILSLPRNILKADIADLVTTNDNVLTYITAMFY